jgi:uncharacterized repeat protein (TIGR01451 family)
MRSTSEFLNHAKTQLGYALSQSFQSVRAKLSGLAVLVLLLGAIAKLFPSDASAFQSVSFTTAGSAISQNFDTLSNTAGSTTNNLTLTGWFMTESGGSARDNEQYAVDTGGSNTGDTYSYGSTGDTDRALGGLQSGTLIPSIGACFTNNTGVTITSLRVDYTGEQWRIANTAAARDDRMDFQYSTDATSLTTGTWTDVNALDFTNPIKTAGTAGALDGNAAANRTAISSTISSLSIANGATLWIRWNDLNASGADDGLAVDDFSITPNPTGGVVTPTLSVNDVTQIEGDVGTTTFAFTVSLSSPAGPGGVTFDIATADNTAMTSNNDYVLNSLTGQTITAGNSSYTFNVTVNGDTTTEANETFFVNVTNVTGAIVIDGQGQGTINNDDVTLTAIHDIQGPGASSPIVGASVTTRGIVTGVKSNGFFIQEPDANADADPATSEGIFVFTSSAPPAAAVVGNLVQVTATVVEFVPSQDPQQPPLTELSSPTVTQITTGNPLPAAIPLTATFPDPTGVFDQLERVEGMRVSVASFTVGGPTLGSVNEPNATATSTGVFFGTVTGVPRAFREAGIQHPDTVPSGTIPPIPRWDTNPELIRVDSDGLIGGLQINVATAATVTGLIGPLDYGFRRYTILPDPASPPMTSGGMTATAVTTPTSTEFTVASYNLERFFDDVNDPAIGEPVLTTTAYQNRLTKASLGIRDYLKTPDIVGIVEIENLSTLQALATKINADAIANSQPNPMYTAHLVEGNDVGGIDVGFLVKTAIVTGSTPRVTVNAVVQELDASVFTNPNATTETLHDRPPLRLDATVNFASGATFPVQVIVNHLRSLNGVSDTTPGSNGWATDGDRIRAKRLAQVVDLANLIQTRQTNNPNERMITVGDFNFFEVNDGYGDSMSTLLGAPVPDNQTVVPGDGVDLVTPDLTLLLDSLLQRYSFVFDGNAQSLDHAIINSALIAATSARRLEHARINGDFPETDRNGLITRLADHDPLVAYFQIPTADLAITKTDGATTEVPGTSVTYTIIASNAGPSDVTGATVADTLPATLSGATWTCVGAGGGTCTAMGTGNINDTVNLPSGASVTYTLTANISASATGTLANTATVSSSTTDPTPGNNSATDSDTLTPLADLSITKTDGVTSAVPGGSVTYTIVASNAGPSDAPGSTVADTFPAVLTATWTCVGAGGGTCTAMGSGNINDTVNLPAGGSVTYTVTAAISASATGTLSNTASVATGGGVTDPTPGNNMATDTDTLTPTANLGITKTNGVTSVTAGNSVTYTIVASNVGPSDAPGSTVTDTFPATITGVTWTCVGAGGGTCPANGSGNINATVNLPAGGSVTFTATGTLSSAATGTLTNTATVATSGGVTDPTPGNNSATDTDTIAVSCTITCPSSQTAWTSGTSATVNYPAPTTTGVCGTVTCSPASGSTFNVGTTTVNCSANAGPTCSFTVTVNRLTFSNVSLSDPLTCTGPGNKINGSFAATNTTGASATVSVTAALTNLVALPGMATATQPGTLTVLAGSINWTGTLGAGQTVTVNWMGQILDNQLSGAQACSLVTAMVNSLPVAGSASACLTVNCPAVGPGALPSAFSPVSDQKAGSVLIYNIYTSSTDPTKQNTRINLTNTHPSREIQVHLYFVAEGCSVADSYVCLTPNQTTSFITSDFDPGTTGYIVAVATDQLGCPINFNYLIGDEFVKFSSGHAANLGAEAISAIAGGLTACDNNSVIATLNFDGVSYNQLPRSLAASNIPSRADGNDTMLIANRIGGNLGIGAATLGTVFGIFYDDAENAVSFTVTGSCQLRGSISNNFPRTTPRFEQLVPAGRTGWLKLFRQESDIAMLGAMINFNPNSTSSIGAFNQGHNLHKLTLSSAGSYVIPVFPPPGC